MSSENLLVPFENCNATDNNPSAASAATTGNVSETGIEVNPDVSGESDA